MSTTAPDNLLAVRRLLLTHLGGHGLSGAEVGIVGDTNHRGGYHCGEDRVVPGDYSVVESARDRAGLSRYACALDVGQFRVTTPKGSYDLPHYSRWLVAQCEANAPDTRDIREVIYSPDGRTVRRWDRLGRRAGGDSTHLFHTHESYFRDAITAGRDQTAVKRRYLTEIGLLEDDMPLTKDDINAVATRVWSATWGPETAGGRLAEARDEARKARLTGEAVLAAVKGLDTKAVLARIEAIAQEERQRDDADAQRDAVLAELVRQYQSGERDAAAIVDELAARLGQARE